MSLTATPVQQYSSPGVYVTEQVLPAINQGPQTSPSVAGFAGEHWRGPAGVAVRCTSWRDFQTYFGGFQTSTPPVLTNPWLPYAVYEFFNNGGTTCWINRIVAAGTGAPAQYILKDGAATPQNTLQLTAGFLGTGNSIGTWGNNLYVQVTQPTGGAANPGTFGLVIYNGGTQPGNVVEQWSNLSMSQGSVRYAPAVLNSVTSGSLYVYATDLFSNTAAPLNAPAVTPLPPAAGAGPWKFTGGTDATTPAIADRQNAFLYGSSAFDVVPGMLNINLPGETNSSVLQTAMQYCTSIYSTGATTVAARPYSFLVIDPPQGSSPGSVISYMQTLQGLVSTSFAALYYPWVNAADPSTQSFQATRTMPPGGFILGQMATTDTLFGPWYAPAGMASNMTGAVGMERILSQQNYGALNLANVNALKIVPNTGQVIIWGARTLMTQWASVYVPIRRTLNFIEARLADTLQFAVFQPNNSMLWANITAACDQFLSGLAGRNAFQGTTTAQQYYVTCNASNNPPSSVAQGIVNTQVGVALNYPAEFVQLTVTQFQATAQTVVTSTF